MLYGLIGFPLGHSASPNLFKKIWDEERLLNHEYRLFPLSEIIELPALISDNPLLRGLNVTIPYKQEVLGFCDELSAEVKEIGAANTLKIERKDGRFTISAHNSDIEGFSKSLGGFIPPGINQALVLGNGGASKAVQFCLRQMGINFNVVSRKVGKGLLKWQNLDADIVKGHSLIINTTPVGMAPSVSEYIPLPWDGISCNHYLYDLIYNPEMTPFLAKGSIQGAHLKNGSEMLELQARAAWKIWQSVES